MPTKDRLLARASAEQVIDLHEASARSGYASETLRKMMWGPNPPPLFKNRSRRWVTRAGEFEAWLAERDSQAAAS